MFENVAGVAVKGWLSGLDLAEAYASSDILLFPSDVETFGNVTLEVGFVNVAAAFISDSSQSNLHAYIYIY